MRTYSFTVVATGLDPSTPNFEDRFFEAGCDDATLAFQKGAIMVEFERQSKNLIHAISSAVNDVRHAGARVVRVEPDVLVTASDIAERAQLTRAAISLFSRGERGEKFPAPRARVTTESPLWDWVEVAKWLHDHSHITSSAVVEARIVRFANAQISQKDHARELSPA